MVSEERVEDKHWINSSSDMVLGKGVETRPNASRSLISYVGHRFPPPLHAGVNRVSYLWAYVYYLGKSV